MGLTLPVLAFNHANLAATRTHAFASGIVLGIVLPLQDAVARGAGMSADGQRIVTTIVLAFVFFLPMLLFVVGTRHLSLDSADTGTRGYRASLGQVGVRALCWLAGCGAGYGAFALLRTAPQS